MEQLNFNNQKGKLTEGDIDEIMSIVGSRCREKTKHGWQYYADQSYPDEIRTLRECILKG